MLIGFAGAKGSGKDYAFKIIKKLVKDKTVEHIAFADPIRQKLFPLINIDRQQYDVLKRTPKVDLVNSETGERITTFNGRVLVRDFGMTLRAYNENQFCEYVEQKYNEHPDWLWIVTDVRFVNEVKLIHKLNGIIVSIHRPGVQYDNHITERPLEGMDYRIENSGDSAFENQISKLLQGLDIIK